MTAVPPEVEGAVHFVVGADQQRLADALRRSGAHDLACPAEQLSLRTLTLHSFSELYAAEGCGQRAVYVLEHWDMSASGGHWLTHFYLVSRFPLVAPSSP